MAEYTVLGRADSLGFATAQRLGDLLQASLPDAKIATIAVLPEKWSAKREELQKQYG